MLTIAELHHGIPENVDVIVQEPTGRDIAALRADYYRRERIQHLAVEAELHGIKLEAENALCWVAWSDDLPGECELVTDEGCTCRVFRAWKRCEHHSLLLKRMGRI